VEQEEEAARGLAALAHDQDFPLIVSTVNMGRAPAVGQLLSSGIPVYREIISAARVLAYLAHIEATSPTGLPEPPPSEERLTEDDYWSARRALAAAGVPFVPAKLVYDASEASLAARELGYPGALKAMGLLHKSDAGGVALGLRDEPLLRAACDDMLARLAPNALSVERMAPLADGVEVIVGCRQDPRFGPVVLVGLGGIYAEVLRDTAVALVPVDADQAERLLASLRGAPLLSGARPAAARRSGGGAGHRGSFAFRGRSPRGRGGRGEPPAGHADGGRGARREDRARRPARCGVAAPVLAGPEHRRFFGNGEWVRHSSRSTGS